MYYVLGYCTIGFWFFISTSWFFFLLPSCCTTLPFSSRLYNIHNINTIPYRYLYAAMKLNNKVYAAENFLLCIYNNNNVAPPTQLINCLVKIINEIFFLLYTNKHRYLLGKHIVNEKQRQRIFLLYIFFIFCIFLCLFFYSVICFCLCFGILFFFIMSFELLSSMNENIE